MQLFFAPNINVGLYELSKEEARHAVQVLRKKAGDVLDFVDGKGGWYQGVISTASKRSCLVEVEQLEQEEKRMPYRLTMLVSPTKSNDRFEWFLEKATEIGVDVIVPLKCQRTERPRIRKDRYEKVLVSAMKQSLQAWLPKLEDFQTLNEFYKDFDGKQHSFVAWCEEDQQNTLWDNYQAGKDVFVFIGPEGDFTNEEVQMIISNGGKPVSLGKNRLRTETAAIFATQTISLLNFNK